MTNVVFQTHRDLHTAIGIDKINELERFFANRCQDLKNRFTNQNDLIKSQYLLADTYHPVSKKTSAGMFPNAYIDGELNVLLGQRRGHRWWGNFGGKSDIDIDQKVSDTARRETREESFNHIDVTSTDLDQLPSHDIITKGDFLYRMYFAEVDYIDSDEFNKQLKTVTKETSQEHANFKWVKVTSLLEAIEKNSVMKEEGQRTVKVTINANQEIILHAPLYEMLLQSPVHKILVKLTKNEKIRLIHTKGHQVLNDKKIKFSADKITTQWLEFHQPSSNSSSNVPFGQNAMGNGIVQRITNGLQEGYSISETIIYNPEAQKEILVKAVINQGRVNTEIKRNASNNRCKQVSEFEQQLKNAPYTQTEAFLKAMLGEDFCSTKTKEGFKYNIKKYFKKRGLGKKFEKFLVEGDSYLSTLIDACLKEREKNGWVVFYHACNPEMGFMFDVFSEFRRQLMMLPQKGICALRSIDTHFAGLQNVDEFIASLGNNWDDGDENYKKLVLAANLFLLGGRHNGETTSFYFADSRSVGAPFLEKILNEFFSILGMQFDFATYECLYDKYIQSSNLTVDDRNCNQGNGRLLQIFKRPDEVEELACT